MALEITLIGTHHFDPQGRKRLTKLLNHLQPDVVSYENSEQGIKSLEMAETNRKNPEYSSTLQSLAQHYGAWVSDIKFIAETQGYEYYAARDYCRKRQIPLILSDQLIIEYTDSSERYQEEVQRLIKLSKEEILDRVKETYSSSITIPESETAAFEKRDAETAKTIRTLEGKVAHIAGLGHCYAGNYNNLFRQLADLSPQRMRLTAADRI